MNDEESQRFLAHLLPAQVEFANTKPHSSALFGGFTGLAWSLEHLGGMFESPPDLLFAVDEALLSIINRVDRFPVFDLIQGVTGILVYALERVRSGHAHALVAASVTRLLELSDCRSGRAAWRTSAALLARRGQAVRRNGVLDLGIAHGTPGPLAALAKCEIAGCSVPGTKAQLRRTAEWLIEQQDPRDGVARFPVSLEDRDRESRLAWCYGDLSVAVSLAHSGRAIGDNHIVQFAIDTAANAANREFGRSGVVDGSLCHGAVGVAHILQRFFLLTREPLFEEKSIEWYSRAIAMYERDPDNSGRTGATDILTGPSGILLALQSFSSGIKPSWDRLLLMDIGDD